MQKVPVVGLFLIGAGASNPVRWGVYPGFAKAVQIHNRIMEAFEEESAPLSASSPPVGRYAAGLAAWVAGNHEWHATHTDRYSLPDYW